jgi:hypothetical protein
MIKMSDKSEYLLILSLICFAPYSHPLILVIGGWIFLVLGIRQRQKEIREKGEKQ